VSSSSIIVSMKPRTFARRPSSIGFGRKRFGDEGYATEELVAELGAAFLCAGLELTPEPRARACLLYRELAPRPSKRAHFKDLLGDHMVIPHPSDMLRTTKEARDMLGPPDGLKLGNELNKASFTATLRSRLLKSFWTAGAFQPFGPFVRIVGEGEVYRPHGAADIVEPTAVTVVRLLQSSMISIG
jgi:hypothetical protein